MRHCKRTIKLGRTSAHLRAMQRSLVCSLFTHGRIVTTKAKAKACRSLAERMIQVAKDEGAPLVHRYRRALAELNDKQVVKRLFRTIAPLFAERAGGYTRILNLSATRLGDNGARVLMELTDKPAEEEAERGIVSRLVGRGKKEKAPPKEDASGDGSESS